MQNISMIYLTSFTLFSISVRVFHDGFIGFHSIDIFGFTLKSAKSLCSRIVLYKKNTDIAVFMYIEIIWLRSIIIHALDITMDYIEQQPTKAPYSVQRTSQFKRKWILSSLIQIWLNLTVIWFIFLWALNVRSLIVCQIRFQY